jgi:hypothetical protein
MGWTLQQCRERFGSEFTPTDTDSCRFSDNMSYSHLDWSKFNEWRRIHKHDEVIPNSTLTTGADTHYFHVDSVFDVYLNLILTAPWEQFNGLKGETRFLKRRLSNF